VYLPGLYTPTTRVDDSRGVSKWTFVSFVISNLEANSGTDAGKVLQQRATADSFHTADSASFTGQPTVRTDTVLRNLLSSLNAQQIPDMQLTLEEK